ncbi:EAL domain-containing protein [Vibrio sp. MMG022]|uniref:EAL domain-containing protein n=1 Tax=Vibrio jasicida TaxID=766224 RepID=A0ABW7JHW6_9VIBR|nr:MULTISPECIES: EAL domain-containing protein [Vibrio]KIP67935.1 diguanylate phosphodiesterase [Vibrio harveyi]MCF6450647.1 EAL domain-containing protein [Vibrio sp. MMG023]PMO43805.1 diguanylate phosphodiesterase [Vibrio sp. 10N.222.52.B12]PQJ71721.1 diguanylate phosphodiesterase [Vibrio jasicida]
MNNRYVNRLFTLISSNSYINGLCNVLVMLLPVSLISAFSTLLSNFFMMAGYEQVGTTVGAASSIIWKLFPILLLVYFSQFLSSLLKVSRVNVITPSLMIYFIVCNEWGLLQEGTVVPSNYPLAIIIPILVGWSVRAMQNRKWFMRSELPNIVDQSYNLIMATTVLVVGYTLLGYVLGRVFCAADIAGFLLPNLDPYSLFDGVIYELVRNLFWSIGINGHIIFAPYKAELYEATRVAIENHELLGTPLPILTTNFFDFYAGLGGAGNTISLVLCMLFLTKNRSYKALATAALILSFFNINEPIIFGLPIMFNPLLIVPFLIAPVVGLVIAYVATALGLVAPMTEIMSWMTPPLMSGYVGTGSTWTGAVLQLIIILVGVIIYYPFFKQMDNIGNANASFAKSLSDDFFNYEGVESGKSAGAFFPEITSKFAAQKRITDLKNNGEFILYYQPQVNTRTGEIRSLEVLIRHRSESGEISPPTFLDDFAKVGLMSELDLWVVETALKESAPLADSPNFKVSINMSPETCLVPDFTEKVLSMINQSALSYSQVEFEITEDMLIQDEHSTHRVLTSLREAGVKIALDDFGSGYSSIGYLSKYDFDKVKIDRSLVLNLNNKNGRELFRLTAKLVKITGAETVAEGIETEAELEFMAEQNIHLIQGFYFYKPMPFEDVLTLNFSTLEEHSDYDHYSS